jgi:hypothetical protein
VPPLQQPLAHVAEPQVVELVVQVPVVLLHDWLAAVQSVHVAPPDPQARSLSAVAHCPFWQQVLHVLGPQLVVL